MTKPLVSVIIPAYRAAGTIGRAIESLLAQTRQPDEIVVVDDGSPDDIALALEPFAENVRLICTMNQGAAMARNVGIEASRGDLLAFLDADDYWEPRKLERQLQVMSDHPEVGLVASRFYSQPPGGDRVLRPAGHEQLYGRVLSARGCAVFDVMAEIWTTTVLVRRDVLGTNRFLAGFEPAEDRDLWIRLVDESPVYLDPEPAATWVLEPDSLSRGNIDRDCGNMLRVVRRHRALLDRAGLRSWESYVFRRWAAGHLGQGHPREAILPAWERLRRQPSSLEAWWIAAKSLATSMRPAQIIGLAAEG
ncbi:glycosyltransferase family 2 protein [Singulisphaera sp. PoT]|uniref:glycosyltransferase family 2 protein n=1 Tax=Singulisphaera sp. PoT TaxID=3411797 RepID=UPI003BF4C111